LSGISSNLVVIFVSLRYNIINEKSIYKKPAGGAIWLRVNISGVCSDPLNLLVSTNVGIGGFFDGIIKQCERIPHQETSP